MESEGVRITTLVRLWNAARSLDRLRAASGGSLQTSHPMASSDPLLWSAFELRLLDVRAADAFTARHVPDSVSIPAEEAIGRSYELPPRWRTLVVMSDEPEGAMQTVHELRERGWLRAMPLVDSLREWPGPWEQGPARRVLWEPTPAVRRWAAMIPPGPVCDLGCGAGRDSVYLALRGHEVTAVDVLPDALKMTQDLAARMGVSVCTQLLNLRRERPADGPWRAVLMLRFLERGLFRWITEHLAPGGIFLFESFTRDQVHHGTPRRQKRTIESQAPLRMFCDLLRSTEAATDDGAANAKTAGQPRFDILEYLETQDLSGDFVARLVARRAAGETPRPQDATGAPTLDHTDGQDSPQETDDAADRNR
jgi:SAM-dependent methyltransferase